MARSTVLAAVAAVVSCAPAVSAYAQDTAGQPVALRGREPGWYGSLLGGANLETDMSFVTGIGGGEKLTQEYSSGFTALGTVGYNFGRVAQWGGFRTALEVGYRQNKIDHHVFGCFAQPRSSGTSKAWSTVLNAYYDLYLPASNWAPYVGLGVGEAHVTADSYRADKLPILLDDSDTVFAYQAMVGASYALSPSLSLVGEYRYFGTRGVEMTTTIEDGRRTSKDSYSAHMALVGLLVNF